MSLLTWITRVAGVWPLIYGGSHDESNNAGKTSPAFEVESADECEGNAEDLSVFFNFYFSEIIGFANWHSTKF